MSRHAFILFPSPSVWRIAIASDEDVSVHRLLIPESSTPTEIASLVSARLKDLRYLGRPVLLAVSADACLSATLDTSTLSRPDRKTLLFRLEEKLPIAAESLVADFIPSGHTTLGVCARTDTLLPLVQSLESAGVLVQSVAPTTLLAAESVLADDVADHLLLVAEDEQISLLTIRHQTITHWHAIPSNPHDLAFALRLVSVNDPSLPLRAVGLVPELAAVANNLEPVPDTTTISAATKRATAILAGKGTPLVELRRDALAPSDPLRIHRGSLNALLAAAAIFLIAFALSCVLLGQRYARAAADAEQRSLDAFAAALPGWPTPTNVLDVLESEFRKRAGTSTASPEAQQAYTGLDMLQDVLSRFPRDVRCTIETLTFSPDSLEMSGRIHTYADADRIAAAARDASLEVPPPQVRRDPDARWRFALRGTRPNKPAPQSLSMTTNAEGGARHE